MASNSESYKITNVIFDTNAIRDLIEGVRIDDIEFFSEAKAKKLSSKNLRVLISPIVVFELLYHLVDQNDEKYGVSYKALRILMLIDEFQSRGGVRYLMKPSELLIAHEIYNMHCESRELMYKQWMDIATLISHGSINEIPDLRTHDGESIKKYIEDIENGFVSQIRDLYNMVLEMAKNHHISFEEEMDTPRTEAFLISLFSRTAYTLLMDEGKLPDYHEFLPQFAYPTTENCIKTIGFIKKMEEDNKKIVIRYPAPLALMKKVLMNIHINGKTIGDKRLKNFVWDIRLMFHANDHTIDKEPFILVTTDKSMTKASGLLINKYVFTLSDFMAIFALS